MSHPLNRNERTLSFSLPGQIAERLAAAIIDGTFAGGDRLKEVELAASFGVSRAPLREALRILEGQGLVRLEAQRGAQVTRMSMAALDDLFEIRAALYEVVTRRLVARADQDLLRRVRASIDKLSKLSPQPEDRGEYARVSFELSLELAAATGSERLAELIHSFALQAARYTRLGLISRDERRQSARLWRAYLKALEEQEVEQAVYLSRQLGEQAAARARAHLEPDVTKPDRSNFVNKKRGNP